ncbi:MAG: type II secretion system F family protein [Planctomycetales bacterium]
MFTSRIRLSLLSKISRNLATLLAAGVPIVKAFETVAKKTYDGTCRKVLYDVINELKSGSDLTAALESHPGYFPDLFVDLSHIAEVTGNLPEVLDALANHYDQNLQMKKEFISLITPPLLQLVFAIFVVAGLIFVLGMIVSPDTHKSTDMLGWGLMGEAGAVKFLTYTWGTIFGLWGLYLLCTRGIGLRKQLHTILMYVPVLGYCMRSFAIARFSWAFYLTQQAGMMITPSLQASLRATGNGAFQGTIPFVTAAIDAGEDLSYVLNETRLFPQDFIEMVIVGETSGTVPETLHRLSPRFEEQARRALKAVAGMIGWLVWLVVAGFIIFVIFSIMMTYIGMINELNREAGGVH